MAVQGELAKLVESERRLDAELADAREQAAELTRRAQADADALRRRFDEEVAAAAAARRTALEDEQVTVLAAIQAEARRLVERYDAAPADRVDALARLVIRRLLEGIAA